MDSANRKVYTVEEVAEQLGVSRTIAYRLAKQKVFPVLNLGRRVVIPKERFDRWLESAGTELA